MTDLDDLRRRAQQMSQYGNYWAGKCVALVDRVRRAERQRDEARHALALAGAQTVQLGPVTCGRCGERISPTQPHLCPLSLKPPSPDPSPSTPGDTK